MVDEVHSCSQNSGKVRNGSTRLQWLRFHLTQFISFPTFFPCFHQTRVAVKEICEIVKMNLMKWSQIYFHKFNLFLPGFCDSVAEWKNEIKTISDLNFYCSFLSTKPRNHWIYDFVVVERRKRLEIFMLNINESSWSMEI